MLSAIRDASSGEPVGDLGLVESNEPSDLVVRHPFVGDETADVAYGDAEALGELVDVQELGVVVDAGHVSPFVGSSPMG
jgi:hypothetical protein